MVRRPSCNLIQRMEDGSFWYEETPIGAINGVNQTFTLSATPNPASSLELEVNGQTVLVTTDYSITGDTLTMVYAYPTGVALFARYRAL